jgi:hypothetical protein
MNSDRWKSAHQTPVDKDLPPSDHTRLIATIWTLSDQTHTCRAELWALRGVPGIDLRYTIDGELRETEFYRGADGGTKATLRALAKKDELIAKGWA